MTHYSVTTPTADTHELLIDSFPADQSSDHPTQTKLRIDADHNPSAYGCGTILLQPFCDDQLREYPETTTNDDDAAADCTHLSTIPLTDQPPDDELLNRLET